MIARVSSVQTSLPPESEKSTPTIVTPQQELSHLRLAERCQTVASKALPRASLQEFIKDHISRFLHPYITGQITEATESKERKSVIELLFSELENNFPDAARNQKEEIESLAFKTYLLCSAQGLYVHYRKKGDSIIKIEDKEFNDLLSALEKALPKDFPRKKLSPEELKIKTVAALEQINEQRAAALQERFLTFTSNVRPPAGQDSRIKIDQYIKEKGILFIEENKKNSQSFYSQIFSLLAAPPHQFLYQGAAFLSNQLNSSVENFLNINSSRTPQ